MNITSNAVSPTNSQPIAFSIAFSSDVLGFTLSSLVISGGTGGFFTAVSARLFTVSVTPSAPSVTVTVSVPAGAAVDAIGNANLPAQLSVVYNAAAPTAVLTTTALSPSGTLPIPVLITFNEAVKGFTAAGLQVTGGSVQGAITGGPTAFLANILPNSTFVTVSVRVRAHVATDAAGNQNVASSFLTVQHGSLDSVLSWVSDCERCAAARR